MGYTHRGHDMIVKIDKDNKGIHLCPIDCTELIDDKCPLCGFDNRLWGSPSGEIWVSSMDDKDDGNK